MLSQHRAELKVSEDELFAKLKEAELKVMRARSTEAPAVAAR